jgi:hypothetical protein
MSQHTTTADVAADVRAYIIERFLFGQGGDSLSNDQSFLESGIVDSTGVLEVVMFLEPMRNWYRKTWTPSAGSRHSWNGRLARPPVWRHTK